MKKVKSCRRARLEREGVEAVVVVAGVGVTGGVGVTVGVGVTLGVGETEGSHSRIMPEEDQ